MEGCSMKQGRIVVGAWIGGVLLAAATHGLGATQLDELKRIYATEVAKVHTQYKQDMLRMPGDHIGSLRELEQAFQRAGDLKSLLAVQEERTRFTRDPRADAISVAAAPPQLAALQSQYVKAYGDLKGNRDFRLKDLFDKYLRRLEALQRELTIRGEIDDAMQVMKAIEHLKQADVGGDPGVVRPPPGPAADAQVSIETLRRVIKGKIAKWNSLTREIVLEYDFAEARQVADWKGGELDADQAALFCSRTIAWLRPQFESLTEIEVDAQIRDSDGRARVMLGNSLFVDLINSGKPRCVVFQTSEHNPVLTVEEKLKTVIGNRVKLQFGVTGTFLVLNYSAPRRLGLQTNLRFPSYLGVGLTSHASAYGNVRVSGVLTSAFVKHVSSQAGR
jgi:hypothetical protein